MSARHIIPIAGLAVSLTLAACERSPNTEPNARNAPSQNQTIPEGDNSARNTADRNPESTTPLDQSNDPAAIKITAEIRRAIIDDPTMSTNAQNCKIITDKNGVVTLRGPVDSASERAAIEAKARAVPGVTDVINKLEGKPAS